MSKLLAFSNRGNYAPWQRPPLRSDSKVRASSRSAMKMERLRGAVDGWHQSITSWRQWRLCPPQHKYVIPFAPMGAAQLEDGIDGVQFDYGKLLAYLLRLYKLDDVARDPNQPSVQFSITLDGADLSRNITHITAGIQINDPRAIDPISGIPIGMQDSKKVQSRGLCYAAKILIAKDTKRLYDKYFSDFFSFFKEVKENGFGQFSPGSVVTLEVS
jgi:hypothetical protein